jgi:hypothetical protein
LSGLISDVSKVLKNKIVHNMIFAYLRAILNTGEHHFYHK